MSHGEMKDGYFSTTIFNRTVEKNWKWVKNWTTKLCASDGTKSTIKRTSSCVFISISEITIVGRVSQWCFGRPVGVSSLMVCCHSSSLFYLFFSFHQFFFTLLCFRLPRFMVTAFVLQLSFNFQLTFNSNARIARISPFEVSRWLMTLHKRY